MGYSGCGQQIYELLVGVLNGVGIVCVDYGSD